MKNIVKSNFTFMGRAGVRVSQDYSERLLFLSCNIIYYYYL